MSGQADPSVEPEHASDLEQDDDLSDAGDETNNPDSSILDHDNDDDARTGGLPNGHNYLTPDEPTNYSLYTNPPNLGLIRQRLFNVDDPVELSIDEFEVYFPFVDNVWRKTRTGDPQQQTHTTTEWYWCRLRKTMTAKAHIPKPTPEGKKTRRKRTRDDTSCGMSMKVIFNEGMVKTCTVIRGVGKDIRHSHDLDHMDKLKRNSAIMEIARRESIKGFLPGSTFAKMCDEPHLMDEAGGKFMKVSDVRNGQYAWRQANPTMVLKAHTGWQQARAPRQKHIESPMAPPAAHAPLQPPPPPQMQVLTPAPVTPMAPLNVLRYPDHAREFLEPYMPAINLPKHKLTPHITLTYASSLDSRISLAPGLQTVLSGPESKAMTHYLRSRHDAILIGVHTAIADDPGLNCRLEGAGGYGGLGWEHQPRPIIIDPHARLHIRPEMRMLRLVAEKRARAPWIIVSSRTHLHPVAVSTLKAHGGEYLMINDWNPRGPGFDWEAIFNIMFREGLKSIMIEGGGVVLSELLKPRYTYLVDSVVVTIAPTFLGKAGTTVSPDPTMDQGGNPIATRLQDVRWQPMGIEDVILCARPRREHLPPPPPPPPQQQQQQQQYQQHQHQHQNGILPGIEEFSKPPIPTTGGNNIPAPDPADPSQSTQPLPQQQPA